MKNFIAVFFVASTLLFACKSSKSTTTSTAGEDFSKTTENWIIASEQVKCNEESEALCFQVKKPGSMDYETMNVAIENFAFEPGYKYQIQLNIIPSKKGETRYEMVKQLHKVAIN